MTGSSIPTFGEPEPDRTYIDRPGAYAILTDGAGRIGVVRTRLGFFLPGGAIEPGESPEEALRREILEETGLEVGEVARFRSTIDYFLDSTSPRYFQVRSIFFTAAPIRQSGQMSEVDHELVWVTPSEAAGVLYRPSQAWVIEQWMAGGDPSTAGRTASPD